MTAPTVAIQFRADGSDAVQRAIDAITRRTEQAQTQAALAAQRATGGAAAIARNGAEAIKGVGANLAQFQGRLTNVVADIAAAGGFAGNAKNRLINVAGDIAFSLGPTGMLVGAAGVAALAIGSVFSRMRDEMDESAKKFKETAGKLVNDANAIGLGQQSALLRYGTISEGNANSLEELRRRRGAIQARPVETFADRVQQQRDLERLLRETVVNPLDAAERITYAELERRAAEFQRRSYELLSRRPITIEGGTPKPKTDAAAAKDAARRAWLQRILADTSTPAELSAYADRTRPVSPGALAGFDQRFGLDRMSAGITDVGQQVRKQLAGVDGDVAATVTGVVKKVNDGVTQLQTTSIGRLATSIATTVGSGIQQGLQTLLSSGSIGDAFRALGDQLVSGLASALAEYAMQAAAMAKLVASIQRFMVTHPVAAIAAAGALLVIARSLRGRASSAAMYSGGGIASPVAGASAAASDATTRLVWGLDGPSVAAGMTPRQAVNITVIGPHDPTAQRQILELIQRAERR